METSSTATTTNPKSSRLGWIKALTVPLIVLVITLVFVLWETFIPKSYFAFSSISIPDELRRQGINENYIKREIIKYIQTDVDSASIKINQLFLSEKSIEDISQNTDLKKKILQKTSKIFSDGRFQIGIGDFKFSYGELVKFLRKRIGKRDIYADITFIKEKNKGDATLTIERSQKTSVFREYSILYDSTRISVKEAFSVLYKKISVAIEEQYDPVVSVLSDYSFSASYDVNNLSWNNNYYKSFEKSTILKKNIATKPNPYQSKWSNMLLASIYEENGLHTQNEDTVSESIKYYKAALSIDTLHSSTINDNIAQVSNYLAQSFTQNPDNDLLQTILKNNKKINSSEQILVCYNRNSNINEATFIGFEKNNNKWDVSFEKIKVNLGTKGFADFQLKIEGDLKAPTGIFTIGSAYGYKNDLTTKMSFITLTNQHLWITDPESADYNKLITGPPTTKKYERMIEPNQLNKYGIIINYNMHPTIKNKGSAITIHVQRKPGFATAGCISMQEKYLKNLIEWLDPAKKPVIAMGVLEEIKYRVLWDK